MENGGEKKYVVTYGPDHDTDGLVQRTYEEAQEFAAWAARWDPYRTPRVVPVEET